MVLLSLALLSSLSFAVYGFRTLFGIPLQGDFVRFGIPRLRVFVGAMQLLGAVGVLLGIGHSPIGALAAAGLVVMMAIALVVRLKVHDAPRLMVPAALLVGVNGLLVVFFLLD